MGDVSECNIKVICRIRPLNEAEERNGNQAIVRTQSDDSVNLQGKTFQFDRTIAPDAHQETVYAIAAKSIVEDVLNGYNGTIFAYGQTSSGKTYTMEGCIGDPELEGIIPRIVKDIFNHIYAMEENVEFHIKVSYFEIYMDKIRDLLDVTKTNLSVHEDKSRCPYVKGATERFVSSPEEVLDIIDEGKSNRHVAVTNMNEHSSRSHSVFLISVKQQNIEKQKTLSGKLYLVDLAGSEKVSKTGAEGTVLDEAKQINKSLSALGNVINALVEGSSHVPYRDSKLTRILQESLGGNARTTMIICCSPAFVNEAETRSTLLFGTRAKAIKNTVMVNEELTADEWRRRFERERDKNARLRGFLLKLEAELLRWRQGERVSETEQCELLKDDALSMSVDATLQLAAAASMPAQPAQTAAPTAPAMILSSVGLPKSSQPWEVERALLYKQLDDRDGEINSLSQYVEKLKVQMLEQEELVTAMRRDADAGQNDLIRLQAENESRNEEVKEVLNALEELALNYDAKQLELQSKASEYDAVQSELAEKTMRAAEIEAELGNIREALTAQRKRFSDVLIALLKDFAELVGQLQAAASPSQVSQQPTTVTGLDNNELKALLVTLSSEQRVDDEHLALVRLQLNKAKTELRLLVSRCSQLEQTGAELQSRLAAAEIEVGNARLASQQHEARISALQDSLSALETRKRALENQLDEAQEEATRMRAQEQLHATATNQSQADEVRVLAEQLEQHREAHHKQLTELRDQLAAKEHDLDRLREERQNVQLAFERTSSELDRARADQVANAARLADAQAALAQHEQARADLKGLEETVARELATLHQLRKLFIADLQTRIKRSLQQKPTTADGASTTSAGNGNGNGSDSESDAQPTTLAGQRQRITFLESNLESLTKVHKQLVHDNADLRLEIPKLEKRLRATYERVKALEHALKEAKEAAIRDRKRYQQEVDRIKEAVRQKNLAASRRLHTAQIAKPIRAGQPHAVIVAGGAQASGPTVVRPVLSGGAAATSAMHD